MAASSTTRVSDPRVAERMGLPAVAGLRECIREHFRFSHGGVSAGALMDAVRRDKKASGGAVRLVMPGANAEGVVPVALDERTEALLAEYLMTRDVFGGRA